MKQQLILSTLEFILELALKNSSVDNFKLLNLILAVIRRFDEFDRLRLLSSQPSWEIVPYSFELDSSSDNLPK